MIYTAPDGIHVLDMDTHKTACSFPISRRTCRPINRLAAPFAEPAPVAIPTLWSPQ